MAHEDFFELNSWGLADPSVRPHAAAAFIHSADSLLAHPCPQSWPRKLVDPFHLFACGTTHSGGMVAARHALDVLLSQGARLDAIDASGWTPLCYAAWFGLSSTLDVLVEAGAPVHPSEGPMPLSIALSSVAQRQIQGAATCARLLLMSGADPLKCCISETTGRSSYLSWALATDNIEWANVLAAKGDVIRNERELGTLVWQASAEALDWLQTHGYSVLPRLPADHPHRNALAQAQAGRHRDTLSGLAGAVRSGVDLAQEEQEEGPRKL